LNRDNNQPPSKAPPKGNKESNTESVQNNKPGSNQKVGDKNIRINGNSQNKPSNGNNGKGNNNNKPEKNNNDSGKSKKAGAAPGPPTVVDGPKASNKAPPKKSEDVNLSELAL